MRAEWQMALKRVPKRSRLRVRERLVVLEYATTIGIKPAAARFGLNCKTVRRWRDRWRMGGVEGLMPRYPKRRARPVSDDLRGLIQQARQELHYGSTRTLLFDAKVDHALERLARCPAHPLDRRAVVLREVPKRAVKMNVSSVDELHVLSPG